ADMKNLASKYDAMMKNVANMAMGPLPDDVAQALRELAAAYPDVLTFDEKRGMLRFASDFTFDLGSDALNSSAQSTLVTLAKILNSSNARGFEVDVVGHTDNVPISNAGTRAKHPTNVHLSVHRAISVRDALVKDGVSADRFEVAGFGEYRPVVSNPAHGGSRENRRVEIFLRPMTTAVAVSETPTKAAGAKDIDEPMK
ncbi:MAG TPA: OmpA family protein, partial [Phycisphaerales bacterium]|nr:OmpA family protein [Phycisphaerales bacterium]